MEFHLFYDGKKVTGEVISQTKYFLEVEITSPYSGCTTSCSVPYFARSYVEYKEDVLIEKCDDLLTEIFEFCRLKETYFTDLLNLFRASKITTLQQNLAALEEGFSGLKSRLRNMQRSGKITQRHHQAKLMEARGLINEARATLSFMTDSFLEKTKFDRYGGDLTSALLKELEDRIH